MLRSLAYLAFNSIPIVRTVIEVRETLATSSPSLLDGASPRTSDTKRPQAHENDAGDGFHAFAHELDELHRRTLAKLGPSDVAYINRLERFSQSMQVVGRLLIHVSLDPATFFAGVGALWVHKQLQTTEIGHSALHGAWDRLPGCEKFSSRSFRWDTPVDEESWRR